MVAGHTLVAVPYVLRTTLAVLQNFDRRVEEAAAMLGAPPARVLFEVTLPLIRPGVIAGGIFAFIVSFDQLPISLFLVVPGGETLPVVLLQLHPFRSGWRHRRRLDGLDRARACGCAACTHARGCVLHVRL